MVRGRRDRLWVPREVVDDHRDRWPIFLDQAAHRLALAAAAADHGRVEVVARKLFDPPLLMLGADVGEDDDIGLGADRRHRGQGSGDRILAHHFLAEETVEQRPYLGRLQWRAAFLALQSIGDARILDTERSEEHTSELQSLMRN